MVNYKFYFSFFIKPVLSECVLERWKKYKEIVDIKEQYFNDELGITIESINIRYDMFREEFVNEFNEKVSSLKKYTK